MDSVDFGSFVVKDVLSFLTMLFKESDKLNIKLDRDVLTLEIRDCVGNPVNKPRYPVNIKNNNKLGWYCERYKLCLLPMFNGKYILRKGCGKNKPIRPLDAIEGRIR